MNVACDVRSTGDDSGVPSLSPAGVKLRCETSTRRSSGRCRCRCSLGGSDGGRASVSMLPVSWSLSVSVPLSIPCGTSTKCEGEGGTEPLPRFHSRSSGLSSSHFD